MGRSRERRYARLPRSAARPSGDRRAVDDALQLSQGGCARTARRLLLLFLQRRPAKPVGAVAQTFAHGRRRVVPRPERPLGGRNDGARRHFVLEGRPLVRIRRRRSRFGLGDDSRRGDRHGPVDAGDDRMGEILGRDMGSRLRRILLQRLRRTEGKRILVEERVSESLLPPSGNGTGRRPARVQRPRTSAEILQRLGERRRPLALHPRLRRHVGQ